MKIKLKPDQEIVNTIREGLKRTGGYCPCRRERTEENRCMCQEFKDQIADPGFEGFCHCIYMRKSPAFAGLFRRAAAGQIKAVPAARVLRAYWLDEPEVTAPPFSIF